MGETIVPVPEAMEGTWVDEEEEWEECSVLELSRGKMAETKACVLPRRGSLCLPIMRHGLSVWHVTCTAPVAHPALTSPAGSPQWPGSLQAMSLSLQAGPPGFVQAALVAQHGRMARGLILPAPGHQASP